MDSVIILYTESDSNDDIEVRNTLKDLTKEELKHLFRELGLSDEKVRNNYEDTTLSQYRDELIRCWILEDDEVEDKGGATWESLRNALRSIGKRGIARKI